MENQDKGMGLNEVRALSRDEMGEIVGGATFASLASVKSMTSLKSLLSLRSLYGVDYLANLGRDVA